MEEKKQEIQIEFTKAREYRIFAVTGAWGGVSPQQEVVFDVFVEKFEVPRLKLKLKDGKPVEEIKVGERVIRECQAGLVMRPDIAFSIGQWLISKAKEAGLQVVSGQEGGNGE